MFFFTLPSIASQSPTIVRRNVGFINYSSGIITLNPVNIIEGKVKDGQTLIEIEATPSSNDVVGLQDLYLQLDISSSIFDIVVDDISSGLDPSASSYTVTSSYPNGNLVRSGGPTRTTSNTTATATATATTATPTATTPTTTTTTTTSVSTAGASTSGSSSY